MVFIEYTKTGKIGVGGKLVGKGLPKIYKKQVFVKQLVGMRCSKALFIYSTMSKIHFIS